MEGIACIYFESTYCEEFVSARTFLIRMHTIVMQRMFENKIPDWAWPSYRGQAYRLVLGCYVILLFHYIYIATCS